LGVALGGIILPASIHVAYIRAIGPALTHTIPPAEVWRIVKT
jgi:hypothetical protein